MASWSSTAAPAGGGREFAATGPTSHNNLWRQHGLHRQPVPRGSLTAADAGRRLRVCSVARQRPKGLSHAGISSTASSCSPPAGRASAIRASFRGVLEDLRRTIYRSVNGRYRKRLGGHALEPRRGTQAAVARVDGDTDRDRSRSRRCSRRCGRCACPTRASAAQAFAETLVTRPPVDDP